MKTSEAGMHFSWSIPSDKTPTEVYIYTHKVTYIHSYIYIFPPFVPSPQSKFEPFPSGLLLYFFLFSSACLTCPVLSRLSLPAGPLRDEHKVWPVPNAKKYAAHKARMLKENPASTSKDAMSKTPLGNYLLNEYHFDYRMSDSVWEGSPWMRKFVNMMFVKDEKIQLSTFKQFCILGRGNFGEVHGVRSCFSGATFAKKIQNKPRMKAANAMGFAFQERNLLKEVASPFVVELHYAFQDPEAAYLMLEILSGGNLLSHLNKEERFTEDVAKYFLASILLGIRALHQKGWVYRDLRPENVLLSATGMCKLTNFGLATNITDSFAPALPPDSVTAYSAPELCSAQFGHGPAVDLWSLGCVAYAFFNGASPFSYPTDEEGTNEHSSYNAKRIEHFRQSIFVEYDRINFSDKAEHFCRSLLTCNPDARLGHSGGSRGAGVGWGDVEKHDFFSDFDFEALRNQSMKPPFNPSESTFTEDGTDIWMWNALHKGGAVWDKKDEHDFSRWNYVNDIRFEEEVVESLEWVKENDDPRRSRQNLSGACSMM